VAVRQVTLAAAGTPPPEIRALVDEVATVEGNLALVAAVLPTLDAAGFDWPRTMDVLAAYNEASLQLTDLTQDDSRLTLRGRAVDDTAVVAYVQDLVASGVFASVEIQSITRLGVPIFTPTPSPTPVATATMTPTATMDAAADGSGSGSGTGSGDQPTLVADPRDEFEYDDQEPKPLYLGQVQEHNFYPYGDVDLAVFLAKANRYYRIFTENLAPGADTLLEINVAGTIYTNDDGKPGSLGSEVVFQTGGADVNVLIRVTNRGVYGEERTYQLRAEEVLPTATPTPGSTPTPAPTPTPTLTPSPTPTPTPTFTPTPVPGDQYEPNDVNPSFIGVGEIQSHTFDPQGDVDKVAFPVKDGRQYIVTSANLSFGVDTSLVVALQDESWENDDYIPPGTGNLASGVCFAANVDANAVGTFTNNTSQYGPTRGYDISVVEVPRLDSNVETIDFGIIPAASVPPTQTVAMTGTETITWTMTTADPWVLAAPISGTTPADLVIGIDPTNLDPGVHESSVAVVWETLCTENITVTVEIEAPSPSLPAGASPPSDGTDALSRGPIVMARQEDPRSVEFVIIVIMRPVADGPR
jgi:hypothetical protein